MTMKRSLSDSDLSDDGFGDDHMKDGSPSQSCGHGSDRKKRRGVIEKRRRDRINNSLSELRRLVPTAFEKQGSAKLEKAEILQMTVDHLKVLHQKGVNGYNFDPAALAMDYRSVGFRECAAEVARYLVSVEGMDIQDPLRLRLMSHLQCYSAQREVAAKSLHPPSLQGSTWSAPMSGHHAIGSQYGGNPSMTSHHGTSMLPQSQGDQLGLTHSHSSALAPPVSCPDPMRMSQHTDSSHMRLPPTGSVAPQVSLPSSAGSQLAAPSLHSQFSGMHSQFPVSLNMNSMPMLSPGGHSYSTSTSSAALGVGSMKPYRPWGAELAY